MRATIATLPRRAGDGESIQTHEREVRSAQNIQRGLPPHNLDAQTASKVDQLQASVRTLARSFEALTAKVADLQEVCTLEDRWHAFHQSENRTRDGKLEEALRSQRDLKARLDRIEARSGGDYYGYNSFEAVSRKLSELERLMIEASKRPYIFKPLLLSAILILGIGLVLRNM